MRRRSSATSSRRWAGNGTPRPFAAVAVVAAFAALGAVAAPEAAPAPISRSTAHLDVVAVLDRATMARTGRVRVTLEVSPKHGIHVYAPGSTYRAVALRVAEKSPFRLRAPVRYPTATLYTFRPLNEQVLVYQEPFTLTAEIGLTAAGAKTTPSGATVPLNLVVDYQACDERVCYLPESMPLRWAIRLLPTRAP
jgi:DsbC/DsbD-like thiol-disulfide interchange protein